MSIYQNPFVFEKHNQSFSDYIGLCIKHHKDEKGENTEFHHIFPEHKGGTNDRWNKVHLEYELHVEAHRLLMEAFTEDTSTKMSYVWTKNRGCNRGKEPPNKGQPSETQSCFGRTGELHPMFGQGHLVKGEKNGMFGKEPWNKNLPPEEHPGFGTKRKRVICEHCGKDIAVNIYARFHGDKCKEYKIE